ncbi:MAG: XdhC family protein [Panacagrimonas sp.]
MSSDAFDAGDALDAAARQPDWPQWPTYAAHSDVRAQAQAWLDAGQRCALASLLQIGGSSPRPLGSQMLIGANGALFGAVSGGCVEAAVAAEARLVMRDGVARRLAFGAGTANSDIRLTCGSRIEIGVECLQPDDPLCQFWARSHQLRQAVRWVSGHAGAKRRCDRVPPEDRSGSAQAGVDDQGWWVLSPPVPRLLLVGADAVALSLSAMATACGFEVWFHRPNGPSQAPPVGHAHYSRGGSIKDWLSLDARCAVVSTLHDLEADASTLIPALQSEAFYVGAMGSRRKRQARLKGLSEAGLDAQRIARLHAPVGLDIGALGASEIAVSILADLIRALRRVSPARR